MVSVVYALCAATSLVCFTLLVRSYVNNKMKLIFWSAVCFFFLAIQNIILFIDLSMVSQVDLTLWRTLAGFVGCSSLLFALIWERK
jgi:hypothetical protein